MFNYISYKKNYGQENEEECLILWHKDGIFNNRIQKIRQEGHYVNDIGDMNEDYEIESLITPFLKERINSQER